MPGKADANQITNILQRIQVGRILDNLKSANFVMPETSVSMQSM